MQSIGSMEPSERRTCTLRMERLVWRWNFPCHLRLLCYYSMLSTLIYKVLRWIVDKFEQSGINWLDETSCNRFCMEYLGIILSCQVNCRGTTIFQTFNNWEWGVQLTAYCRHYCPLEMSGKQVLDRRSRFKPDSDSSDEKLTLGNSLFKSISLTAVQNKIGC